MDQVVDSEEAPLLMLWLELSQQKLQSRIRRSTKPVLFDDLEPLQLVHPLR